MENAREYWMIYRGAGFSRRLAPLQPSPSVRCTGDTQEDFERKTTCWRKRGRGRSQITRREKAWSSINHSILYRKFTSPWVPFGSVLMVIYLPHPPHTHSVYLLTGGFLWIFFLCTVLYSTLLHLPRLRFHCYGVCWDRTQECCNFGIGCPTL